MELCGLLLGLLLAAGSYAWMQGVVCSSFITKLMCCIALQCKSSQELAALEVLPWRDCISCLGLPQVLAPLVHERDLYLAWSLKRSKAVNGTCAVVGVVGRGHLRGVVHALMHDSSEGLRFSDLVGGKNLRSKRAEAAGELLQRLAWDGAVGAALWLAWEQRGVLFPL